MNIPIFNSPNNSVAIGDSRCAQTKCLSIDLDFTTLNPIIIDLELIQAIKQFDVLQSLYIDGTNAGADITIFVDTTRQTLVVPNGKRAYLPVIAPITAPVLTFTCGGNRIVTCLLLNFYISPCVW